MSRQPRTHGTGPGHPPGRLLLVPLTRRPRASAPNRLPDVPAPRGPGQSRRADPWVSLRAGVAPSRRHGPCRGSARPRAAAGRVQANTTGAADRTAARSARASPIGDRWRGRGRPRGRAARGALGALGAILVTLTGATTGRAAPSACHLLVPTGTSSGTAHSTLCIDIPPPGLLRALEVIDGVAVVGTSSGAYAFSPDQRLWRIVVAGREARSLARTNDTLAIGTDSGVFLWSPSTRVARRAEGTAGADVAAVAATTAGELLAATARGLLAARAHDAPFELTSLPERDVRGVVTTGDTVWVSAPGALWRRDERGFAAVERGLPDGWWELRGAARRGATAYLAVPRGIWRVAPGRAERIPSGARELVDIGWLGGSLALVGADGVQCAADGSIEQSGTRALGARGAVALAQARGGQAFLLDRRGVVAIECALRPASAAFGHSAAAAPGQGVAVGEPETGGPSIRAGRATSSQGPEPPHGTAAPRASAAQVGPAHVEPSAAQLSSMEDPAAAPPAREAHRRAGTLDDLPETDEIAALRRAVLRELDLTPGRLRELDARARSALLWPEVRLDLGGDVARGSSRTHDQTFSSGSVRDLFDADRDRDSERGFGLTLVWDLPQRADPGFALEISKERRELIELRDQVMERVHRLYFERMRVRLKQRALGENESAEALELAVRDRELTAALDSFSGGELSQRDPRRGDRRRRRARTEDPNDSGR